MNFKAWMCVYLVKACGLLVFKSLNYRKHIGKMNRLINVYFVTVQLKVKFLPKLVWMLKPSGYTYVCIYKMLW